MDVIRRQIPAVTLTYLRLQATRNFPAISAWLKKNGVHDDFKYIPIVECGFRNNLTSSAGARGLWQIMPDVARNMGLVVNPTIDQRLDAGRATNVACILLRRKYEYLKAQIGIGSWILTAAAYNFGEGNIVQAVRSQGKDYFNMTLNAETAEYVYRLIAVKELFEHPELYMSGFSRNIFSSEALQQVANVDLDHLQRGVAVGSRANDDQDLSVAAVKVGKEAEMLKPKYRTSFIFGKIVHSKNAFVDGNKITIELINDLDLGYAFRRKESELSGVGWLIDGRVYIDFGYGDALEACDMDREKGITEQAFIDEQATFMLCVKRELTQ